MIPVSDMEERVMERMKESTVFKLVVTALMAALCYVSFTYLKIPIPTI